MTWFCSKISPSEVVHLVQYSRGELNRHAIVTLLNTPLSAFDSNIIRVRMHVVHVLFTCRRLNYSPYSHHRTDVILPKSNPHILVYTLYGNHSNRW